MQLGEVIRTYRKKRNLTQEEMARRLGVTAPAVNKWEKGNSLPDITLLAPIARLLEISLDTLLSFREELTADEINEIVCELDTKFKEEPYEAVFGWAKSRLEQYPDNRLLAWQMGAILNAQGIIQGMFNTPDGKAYEEYVCALFERALESKDEVIRGRAADSLFAFFMRKKEYEKAEVCLEHFSIQNPDRKRKQAQLYAETERTEEAYQAYEELLFAGYQMLGFVLDGMYQLAVREDDRKRAHMIADKLEEMAKCFEMGRYYEVMGKLELAVLEKDAETALTVTKDLLSGVREVGSFRNAALYEHMKFEEPRKEFLEELEGKLRESFRDERFDFLKNDERWRELLKN